MGKSMDCHEDMQPQYSPLKEWKTVADVGLMLPANRGDFVLNNATEWVITETT